MQQQPSLAVALSRDLQTVSTAEAGELLAFFDQREAQGDERIGSAFSRTLSALADAFVAAELQRPGCEQQPRLAAASRALGMELLGAMAQPLQPEPSNSCLAECGAAAATSQGQGQRDQQQLQQDCARTSSGSLQHNADLELADMGNQLGSTGDPAAVADMAAAADMAAMVDEDQQVSLIGSAEWQQLQLGLESMSACTASVFNNVAVLFCWVACQALLAALFYVGTHFCVVCL